MSDNEEYGECCGSCTEWKRDNPESIYGQCNSLHILTEDTFYCSNWEDKRPPDHKISELEKNLAKNPNWPEEEQSDTVRDKQDQ